MKVIVSLETPKHFLVAEKIQDYVDGWKINHIGYSIADRERSHDWWSRLERFRLAHKKELFVATVKKQLSNNNTEVELIELDFTVQVSGLRSYNEEEQVVLRINEVRLDPLKLAVRAFKTCPEGESLHRLVSVD